MGLDGMYEKSRMLNIQNSTWSSRQEWYQDSLVTGQLNPESDRKKKRPVVGEEAKKPEENVSFPPGDEARRHVRFRDPMADFWTQFIGRESCSK
ncbi:hypothetical protein Chor_009193 [Crotalus horridus]